MKFHSVRVKIMAADRFGKVIVHGITTPMGFCFKRIVDYKVFMIKSDG